MKRFLRPFLAILFVSLVSYGYSQPSGGGLTSACEVSDILVQNVRITDTNPNDGVCVATFNVAFTLDANNGNKFVFFQTYIRSASRNGQAVNNPHPYPNYFECQNGLSDNKKPPMRADAGNPLLNVAIDNDPTTPVFTNYVPDPSLSIRGTTPNSTIETFTLTNGDTRFFLENLEVVLPYECGTNTQYTFVTDVFATNAAQANTLNCVSCGIETPVGVVTPGGQTNCNVVNGTLTNNTGTPLTVSYSFYADVNGNGILTPSTVGGADILISTNTITIPANTTVTVSQSLTGQFAQFLGQDVFLLVNVADRQLAQLLPTIECAPLPVTFKTFNAKRISRDKVSLNWETATEINNKGFKVQRNSGAGWTDLTLIPSKANGGNSNGVLAYEYTDNNSEKGLTQYRLMQVDIDGRMKASEIRGVRGEAQQSRVMIYPNPSNDGSVTVLFEDGKGNRDVIISDMSGRLVKQYRNVAATTLRMDNLNPGMYSIRIINQADGSTVNEKVVVNK